MASLQQPDTPNVPEAPPVRSNRPTMLARRLVPSAFRPQNGVAAASNRNARTGAVFPGRYGGSVNPTSRRLRPGAGPGKRRKRVIGIGSGAVHSSGSRVAAQTDVLTAGVPHRPPSSHPDETDIVHATAAEQRAATITHRSARTAQTSANLGIAVSSTLRGNAAKAEDAPHKVNSMRESQGYQYCLVTDCYTLEPVDQADILHAGVYCIQSVDGVLRIFQGTSRRTGEKEFTRTLQWDRESRTYNNCMQLRYFRQAVPRRIFCRWVRAVNDQKVHRAKKFLELNVFAVDVRLASSLHALWGLRMQFLHDIRSTVITFNAQRALESSGAVGDMALEKLHAQLSNPYISGIAAINTFNDACRLLIETTVVSVLEELTNKAKETKKNKTGTEHMNVKKHGLSSADGAQEQQQDGLPVFESAPRRLIHRLRSFIKLTDCIVASALIKSAEVKLSMLLAMFARGHQQKVDKGSALMRRSSKLGDDQEGREEKGEVDVDRREHDGPPTAAVAPPLPARSSGMNNLFKDTSLLHVEVLTEGREHTIQLVPTLGRIENMLRQVEDVFIREILRVERLSGRIDLEKTVRQLRRFHSSGDDSISVQPKLNPQNAVTSDGALDQMRGALRPRGYSGTWGESETDQESVAGERGAAVEEVAVVLVRENRETAAVIANRTIRERAVVLSSELSSDVVEYLVDASVIVHRKEICDLRQKIMDSVGNDFAEAQRRSFETVTRLLDRSCNESYSHSNDVLEDDEEEIVLLDVTELIAKISAAQECSIGSIRRVVQSVESRIRRLKLEACVVNARSLRANLGPLQKIELFRARNDINRLKRILPVMLERLCISVHDEINKLREGIDHDVKTLVVASALVSRTRIISGRLKYLFDHTKDARDLNRLLGMLGVNASEKSKECLPKLAGMLDKLNTLHYKLMQGKEDTVLSWRTHIEKRVADLERQSHDLKATASRDGMLPGAKPEDALAILIPLEKHSTSLFAEANDLFQAETVFASCSDNGRYVPSCWSFLPRASSFSVFPILFAHQFYFFPLLTPIISPAKNSQLPKRPRELEQEREQAPKIASTRCRGNLKSRHGGPRCGPRHVEFAASNRRDSIADT